MVRNVTLTIDHKSVTVPENTTILEAARSVNINIPTLCYLKDINEIGACRICCVEVEGMERLVPACDNVVADGMVVFTNSAKAREARRMNLRLILSHHDTSCTNCTRSGNCTLQQLANDFNMRGTHFPKKLRHEAVDYSTPLIRENDKCVQCLRCIQVCENVQSVKIWDLLGTGSRTVVDASYNPEFGARPLRRYVQHTVETMLSRKILEGRITTGSTVTVDCRDGELVLA